MTNVYVYARARRRFCWRFLFGCVLSILVRSWRGEKRNYVEISDLETNIKSSRRREDDLGCYVCIDHEEYTDSPAYKMNGFKITVEETKLEWYSFCVIDVIKNIKQICKVTMFLLQSPLFNLYKL